MKLRAVPMAALYAYAALLLGYFGASVMAFAIDLFVDGMPASAALDSVVRWWK